VGSKNNLGGVELHVTGGPTLWTPRIYEGGTQKEKGESPTWRWNPSKKAGGAGEPDSVGLCCRRKWRITCPMGGGVNAAVALLQWGVYHVPYLSGRFTVVPRAASRPSRASQWGNSLGGLLPVPGGLATPALRWGRGSPVPARVAARRFDEAPFQRPRATSDGLCGELASG
jgi:hypothetical protein